MFNEYHALLVKLGKEHCRKREPLCAGVRLSMIHTGCECVQLVGEVD